MVNLLSHPAFQSAIAPFFISAVAALFIRRFAIQWQGLAVAAGFLVSIVLTTGLSFQPLTSTRKIILCSLVLPFSALVFSQWKVSLAWRTTGLSIAMGGAALWVCWPVLGRLTGPELWMMGFRVASFAAFIGGVMSLLERVDLPRQGGAALSLGIGVGASSIVAASALYGQLALAIAASVGGLLIIIMVEPVFRKYVPDSTGFGLGSFSMFVVATPLGLIGGAATIYAQLPAMSLIFLAVIPVMAAIPVIRLGNIWLSTTRATVLGLISAIPAIWLAWSAAGETAY